MASGAADCFRTSSAGRSLTTHLRHDRELGPALPAERGLTPPLAPKRGCWSETARASPRRLRSIYALCGLLQSGIAIGSRGSFARARVTGYREWCGPPASSSACNAPPRLRAFARALRRRRPKIVLETTKPLAGHRGPACRPISRRKTAVGNPRAKSSSGTAHAEDWTARTGDRSWPSRHAARRRPASRGRRHSRDALRVGRWASPRFARSLVGSWQLGAPNAQLQDWVSTGACL